MDDKLRAAVLDRAKDGKLTCRDAFRVAAELGVKPRAVGEMADASDVHLARCQLGLFGYEDPNRIVVAADEVSPEMEQAIQEGLVLGRLPCAVAWAIAARFGRAKLDVANAAEALGIRISQCQLGAF